MLQTRSCNWEFQRGAFVAPCTIETERATGVLDDARSSVCQEWVVGHRGLFNDTGLLRLEMQGWARGNPDSPYRRAQQVCKRLRDQVRWLVEDLEDGDQRPSRMAVEACDRVLRDIAYAITGGEFPFPHVGTVGDGDLYCDWLRNGKRVHLVSNAKGAFVLEQLLIEGGLLQAYHAVRYPDIRRIYRALLWVGVLEFER